MITVNYRGQYGNQTFQYCYGRIVAELTGQSFRAPGIKLFPQLETAIDGIEYGHGEITIQHTSNHHVLMSPEETAKRIEGFDARLEGFFERAEWYLKYRDNIRQWFGVHSEFEGGGSGIHIRGTDGEWNSPPLDYYITAAIKAGVNVEDCNLFTDDPNCTISKALIKRGATLVFNTPPIDFNWMARCKTLIISNSTFAWWAAFLSKATKVIQPEPLKGFRSKAMPNSYLNMPEWEQVQH